ncbi:MAG TPA: endo-1,4-beta-xylanase [Polyangiaceae bacterium]|nr:endo-1,4-beta-xylanase [Polyangiaceae bacterium]
MDRLSMKQVTSNEVPASPMTPSLSRRATARRSRWRAGALACSLALIACTKREAVVKEPDATPSTTAAETTGPQPTGNYGKVPGVDVLGGAGIRAFQLAGATERVATSVVDVTGQPFTQALRAEIKEKSVNLWDVQLVATSTSDVRTGDVLLASFWFRTEYIPVESGEAETEINFELNHEPFDKSMTQSVRAGAEWRQMLVPFVATRNFAAGEAKVTFRLGYSPRTFDIAGVKVENFAKQLVLADLPRSKATYVGMEANAPWRAKADERIDRLRKADLTVRVIGKDGKPVPNAEVRALLTKHAFNFGTAVPAEYVLSSSRKEFGEVLLQNFNMATLENDLKWEAIEDWGFPLERGIKGVDWLREAGLAVRGHVLVWPGWENTPAQLKSLKDDKPALARAVTDHITRMMTALKGRCDQWDVVNEPFTNHDVLDILGDDVMVDWFKLARSIDPKPKLYINDFAILSGGGGTTAHRDHYEKMIQLLADKKAPFDGIGMQGHFGSSLTAPDDLMAILDRYGKFGKDIAVTEFDVVLEDEELAGNYVRDFYTVLFSHPRVTTLVMWGFWDANHWKKNAVMYRDDMTLKPGGQAYKDLVLGKWRTNEKGATDQKGQFVTRGFKGKYEIVVKVGEQTQTVQGVLGDGGSRVDVKI